MLIFSVFLAGASVKAENVTLNFVTEHYPPFQIVQENNAITGFSIDVIKAMLALTPYQFHIQSYPWSRAYNLARKGKDTCIFLIARNADRETKFQWLEPLTLTHDYLIGLNNDRFDELIDIESAKSYKVGVIKGDRTHSDMLNHGFVEGKNLFIVNDTFSLLKLLQRGEINFILADIVSIAHRANMHKLPNDIFTTYLKVNEAPIELYLACSLNTSAKIVNTLSLALLAVKESEEYQKIMAKWQIKSNR